MQNHWLYILSNNQTVAISIGFMLGLMSLGLGYFFWNEQHKKELRDKYFSEYLEFFYKYLAIKKEEAILRQEKNEEWNENKDKNSDKIKEIDNSLMNLRSLEIKNELFFEVRRYLLKRLDDDHWEEINKNKTSFSIKYKDFSRKRVINKGALSTEEYEKEVNKIKKEIESLIEKLDAQ